jgi:dihydrolipoamide dehydrogenase
MGIRFASPRIDLPALRAWKKQVVDSLADGLVSLADKRGVQLIRGRAEFESSGRVRMHDADISHIDFNRCILASGSRPVPFPGAPLRPGGRVMNSSGALALNRIPESLLIIGAGYTGLELGTVYAALGSRVELAEMTEGLLPGVDRDLLEPLQRRLESAFHALHLNTRVTALREHDQGVSVDFSGEYESSDQVFDQVLVAIGRRPNSAHIGLEKTGLTLDEKGFVIVDDRMRTDDERIFAVGDVTGGPMLAHKAGRQGKVAAEVIAGKPAAFDARAIPAVVYTDPRIAWCGLTETRAQQEKRAVRIQRFEWKHSDRAVSMAAPEGLTKIIAEASSGRILGMGITGRHSEELIAQGVLAIEMGALVDDLALSIHAHPTLSETQAEAAELFTGGATHIAARGERE